MVAKEKYGDWMIGIGSFGEYAGDIDLDAGIGEFNGAFAEFLVGGATDRCLSELMVFEPLEGLGALGEFPFLDQRIDALPEAGLGVGTFGNCADAPNWRREVSGETREG